MPDYFDSTKDTLPVNSPSIIDCSKLSYEETRENCIKSYATLYKNELVFDLNMVPKAIRLRLSEDPVYISRTKALRSLKFAKQLITLQSVVAGDYTGESTSDRSKNILAAVQAQNDLMFGDVNDDTEESRINFAFIAMTREDFENDPQCEVHTGGAANGSLSGGTEDIESREAQFKEQVKERMKKLEEDKNAAN